MKLMTTGLLTAVTFADVGAGAQDAPLMTWYNPPVKWNAAANILTLDVAPTTDYWRRANYSRDNGHFYYREMTGDFVARVKVTGAYRDPYDQAGLMIRIDEKNWIKTGIEFVDKTQNVSTVVTRELSDWSVIPLTAAPPAVWLELTRKADSVEIRYSLDGKGFVLERDCYFPSVTTVKIGVMAAAPQGGGFPARFEGFAVTPK